jgi:hypothetical protein
MRTILATVVLLLASVTLAADRHVYLNESGGGSQLDDCPNPAHNAKGTSNTDELEYCVGGTSAGKVIGTAAGRVASSTCTGGGGAVTAVTNGVSADVDGDGNTEVVHGHPQACVWNMATSDSCEVHAGTYIASGAYADADSQNVSSGAGAGCDRNNCWYASVVAPGPASGAYGTSGSPGYLRGASMNGSIDSWDPDGDKNPADGTYPAILSGDRDNDATFDATTGGDSDNTGTFTGLGGSFNGDAFHAVMVGCMATSSSAYNWCGTGHGDNPWVDTDADGDFDTRADLGSSRDPAFLVIKDLEFKRYNGGNNVTSTTSIHPNIGNIELGGDQSSDGLVVDHIYFHESDYSLTSTSGTEAYWATINDPGNAGCSTWTEIKNSHLEQNNEKLLDDDCGTGNECGCPKNFHDNLVVLNVTSSRAGSRDPVFAYIKSVDTVGGGARKKQHRFWNNEFVMSATTQTGSRRFMDLQAFGNSMGTNLGELWVYGNVFRALGTPKWSKFWNGSCGIGTGSGRVYFFNNTIDMTFGSNDPGMGGPCADTNGELNIGKNNAYWTGGTRIFIHDYQDGSPPSGSGDFASETFANELCTNADTSSPSGQNCTVPGSNTHGAWFVGTSASTNLYDGLTTLAAKASGPLDEVSANNPCDPDGDGAAGFKDWDGTTDITTWLDVAGNTVNCPTVGTALDAGAVQSDSDGAALAADRHVYLNESGGGSQLDDCPNPAHNAKGTSNTDELEYCASGSNIGKVIGTAAGRVANCNGPAPTAVTNGVSADVDGDGTTEVVYGNAQACVYNMTGAASDTCEVHAGVYKNPGARAGTDMNSPVGGQCGRSECWNAAFVALGNGPNMGAHPGLGYGVPGNPAWVRGAVMNGSTDTWDCDGDKEPEASESGCTNYSVVFDGDVDNDCVPSTGVGCWEGTACTDEDSCTGDAFYMAVFGCGYYFAQDASWCPTSLAGGLNAIYLDDDANGDFTGDDLGPSGQSQPWDASWIGIKDVEYRYFNGGQASACSGGTRNELGHINFTGGNGTVVSDGFFVDHVYFHDNGYSLLCAQEHHVALFGDNSNNQTDVPAVVRNAFIVSGNRFVINDDCGEYGECGSSKTFHDNRVVFPPTRADGSAWTGTFYGAFLRDKSHDSLKDAAVPKVYRFYNNEFVWMHSETNGKLFQQECFGSCWNQEDAAANASCVGAGNPLACCTGVGTGPCEKFMGPGQGQTWMYGNIVRFAGGNSTCTALDVPWPCCTGSGTGTCPDPAWDSRWSSAFCSVSDCTGCSYVGPHATGDQRWRFYSFLNTWDMERLTTTDSSTTSYICNGTGTLYSTRGNAMYQSTSVNEETANTEQQATCAGGSNPGVTCTIGGSTCTGGGTCTAVTIVSTASGSTAVVNAGTGRSTWWTAGTKNVSIHAGRANYIPNAAGQLYEIPNRGLCDPDGDGTAGMDYDGDGDNDTSWSDIAGNNVSCPTMNSTISYGAVQPNSDGAAAAPGTIKGATLKGATVR